MSSLWWLLLAGAVLGVLKTTSVEGTNQKAHDTSADSTNSTPVHEPESKDTSSFGGSESDENDLDIDALRLSRMLPGAEDEEDAYQHHLERDEQEHEEMEKRGGVHRRGTSANKWVRIGKRLHGIHERLDELLRDSDSENSVEKRAAKYLRIGRGRRHGVVKFVRIGRSTTVATTNDDQSSSGQSDDDVNSAEKRSKASAKFVRIGRKR